MTDRYVAAIDQGTTSSRCIIFNQDGAIVAVDQREHRQIFPKPGWVEHDATEIWSKVRAVVEGALAKAGLRAEQLSALGITNQRETTVLWDRATGQARAQRHRLAGHPYVRALPRTRRRGRAGPLPGHHRASAGQLLLRSQGRLAAGQRTGAAQPGRAGRDRLRHHRLLADLESHRRYGRRRPCHRCDQRFAHHADESGDPGVGSVDPGRDECPGGGASGDPVVVRGVRDRGRRARRGAGGLRARRSAGRGLRAGLLRPGYRQEHVRHRAVSCCSTPATGPCRRRAG